MSAPVFHPGHDDLHGLTVVLFSKDGSRTFAGRWDREENGNIIMNDVAIHDAASSDKPRDQWVQDTKTYGVAVAERRLAVARDTIEKVVKLREA